MKKKDEPLYTRESLREEQIRLKRVIREQELALRQRLQQLPGEAFFAGVDAVIPPILTGKISNSVLGAGRTIINKAVNAKTKGNSNALAAMLKQAGLFSLAKFAYDSFVRRRR